MTAGCSMRDSTAPRDSARVNRRVRDTTSAAASAPPLTTKLTMPPKSRIWRWATSWPGWVARPGQRTSRTRGWSSRNWAMSWAERQWRSMRTASVFSPRRTRKSLNGDDTDAGGVADEEQLLGPGVVVDGHEAADHVGVPAEVLGRRVDDGVGAVLQRLLEERRGEGVVDDAAPTAVVGHAREGADVGDRQQRVRRGLDPDQLGRVGPRRGDGVHVGQVDRGVGDAHRPVDLVDQPPRAAVGVVGHDQVVAGPQRAQEGVLGGHPAGEGEAVAGALQRGDGASCRTSPGRVVGPGVLVLGLARLVLGEGRGQVDGRDDGPGGRVGVLAGVDRSGLEPAGSSSLTGGPASRR